MFLALFGLIASTFLLGSSAQSYAVCTNYSGLWTQNSWSGGSIVQSQFVAINLLGSLNETLLDGDLQIRLVNSDQGLLANDVQGVDLCTAGAKGHNICNVPPSGGIIIQPQFFWSYLYPSGNYVLSFEAFGDTPLGSHLPVLCGEYTFYYSAEAR
eukprot:TRINITY_DN27392_c0_g1_i1.p1 TRINITY_DN27392_c0_g1~~TRINITY_DN27392_c0_g1_i1.p1  ORF type:complete len:155 (+),score=45.55 TRINITY_DN27392_c0_g1_i1:51-515(+)